MNRTWGASFLLVASLAAGQVTAVSPPEGNDPLARVSMTIRHTAIRPGQNLAVRIAITAGSRGAYLPNFFGDWDETCQSGFSVYLATKDGKLDSGGRGCFASVLGPGPPATQLLRSQYVFLKPGETRVWHTRLTNVTRVPGTYEVRGEYFSAQYRFEEVAELPEVHGLLVVGHVVAQPVSVRIR